MIRSTFALAGTVALAAMIAGPLIETHMQARLLHLRLSTFYEVHAPSQLAKIDSLVEKYAGNEAPLMTKIEEKYRLPVPDVDVRQLDDPIGVAAYLAYVEAATRARALATTAEARFPHVRAAVETRLSALRAQRSAVFELASSPAQLVFLFAVYTLLASRLSGVARGLALIACALVAAFVVQPSIDALSLEKLHGGLVELSELGLRAWALLAVPARLAATTVAALLAVCTVGRHHPTFVLLAYLCAALALSNPRREADGPVLDVLVRFGVADARTVALFRHTDDNLFAIHDHALYSVITLTSAAATGAGAQLSEWASPVFAVGLADRWFVLSRVEASKTDETRVSINLTGVTLPVYAGPILVVMLALVSTIGFYSA
jgi:hypothetical protein